MSTENDRTTDKVKSKNTTTHPHEDDLLSSETETLRTNSIGPDNEKTAHTSDKVSAPNVEEVNDDDTLAEKKIKQVQQYGKKQNGSFFNGRPRYFVYALALWIAEFIVVVVLKRCGILEKEFRFENAVVQTFLPQLEMVKNRLNESISMAYLTQEERRPGYQLAQEGAKAHYPIVIVPGFVTSGLEVWGGNECARKHFRQRLWAALFGARTFLMERDCWAEHMRLDLMSGSDPENIRLRASEGFDAADYFMANYWVFGKLLENLADLGYTPSNMAMMPYDWRIAYPHLEARDGFFTKLANNIEALHKTTQKKVVLTTHSMGALVCHYFFAWVTSSTRQGGDGRGKDWVDKHIHAYVNIAGSYLGVPKAATALLSGEMSDTVIMGTMGQMLEQFFGRRARRDLWNSWGSLWTMLPKGPDNLWSIGADMCRNRSLDDRLCPQTGLSPMIHMTDSNENRTEGLNRTASSNGLYNTTVRNFVVRQEHTAKEIIDFIQEYGAGRGPEIYNAREISLYGTESPSPRTWHDPTRTPLPYAPKLEMYCLYGVGIETERAYYYRRNREEGGESSLEGFLDPLVILDSNVNNDEQNVTYGIRYSDGDGSVPLLSLGYMCADAWRRKETRLNPSGVKIVTREYLHRSEFVVDDPMRGGPESADHVDILGNVGMTEDLMRIVSGFELSKVEDKFVSEIRAIASEINDHPHGGILPPKRWYST